MEVLCFIIQLYMISAGTKRGLEESLFSLLSGIYFRFNCTMPHESFLFIFMIVCYYHTFFILCKHERVGPVSYPKGTKLQSIMLRLLCSHTWTRANWNPSLHTQVRKKYIDICFGFKYFCFEYFSTRNPHQNVQLCFNMLYFLKQMPWKILLGLHKSLHFPRSSSGHAFLKGISGFFIQLWGFHLARLLTKNH